MTIEALSSNEGNTDPSNSNSLSFTEPHTTTLLIVGSFLYLLNVIHDLFQFLFGAGLVGQLILGAIYCVPLGNILPIDIQTSIGTIGYLGLLLLIVEGGLDARLDILSERKNSAICILVALSGIGLPIGLSLLVLHFGYQYTVLESFVVGAALSATSLGTTFAIMTSFRFPTPTSDPQLDGADIRSIEPSVSSSKGQSNLGETRAGTILMGAALLDDIIGLVISSVVANLGPTGAGSQISGWVIARPIVSSVVMLLVTAVLARYISPPFISLALSWSPENISNNKWAYQLPNVALFLFILVVSAYVTIAHYIGSSMLIGAFCAGSLMSHSWKVIRARAESPAVVHWSPHTSFERIAPVQHYVLAPFFFASIGAAIPVRSLFQATTAWRGILYSALMVIAKVLAGAWLPMWSAVEQRLHPRGSATPSWPAGLFVGFALVTRGEIGLLILNIAQAKGLVNEEVFGVGTWAVVLSTLLGPIGQGGTLDLHTHSGQQALRDAGLWDQFLKHARYDAQTLRIVVKSGDIVFEANPKEEDQEGSRPEIDCTALHNILLKSFGRKSVNWGYALASVEPSGKQYNLHFKNGKIEAGFDLIVGADGAWSRVRSRIPPITPFYSGVSMIELGISDPTGSRYDSMNELVGKGSMFAYSDQRGITAQRQGTGAIRIHASFAMNEVNPDWLGKGFGFL